MEQKGAAAIAAVRPAAPCTRRYQSGRFSHVARLQCAAGIPRHTHHHTERNTVALRAARVRQECGKLLFERQYEPRCYLKGEVPTRDYNWHDLLNALVWLA